MIEKKEPDLKKIHIDKNPPDMLTKTMTCNKLELCKELNRVTLH